MSTELGKRRRNPLSHVCGLTFDTKSRRVVLPLLPGQRRELTMEAKGLAEGLSLHSMLAHITRTLVSDKNWSWEDLHAVMHPLTLYMMFSPFMDLAGLREVMDLHLRHCNKGQSRHLAERQATFTTTLCQAIGVKFCCPRCHLLANRWSFLTYTQAVVCVDCALKDRMTPNQYIVTNPRHIRAQRTPRGACQFLRVARSAVIQSGVLHTAQDVFLDHTRSMEKACQSIADECSLLCTEDEKEAACAVTLEDARQASLRSPSDEDGFTVVGSPLTLASVETKTPTNSPARPRVPESASSFHPPVCLFPDLDDVEADQPAPLTIEADSLMLGDTATL